jgi:glycosyltransferase involved in cell wall biosynthesis
MKIIFIVQSLDFLFSHRMKICIEAHKSGFEVCVAAPYSEILVKKVKDLGFDFYELKISRSGMNPIFELRLIYQFYKLFLDLKPDILHLITIKPYLYGGIVARILGVPSVVSAVSGLGIVFSSNKYRYKILRLILIPFYKISFGHNNQKVIFQNKDDRNVLLNWGVIKNDKIELIRGSGVDLDVFSYKQEDDKNIIVAFAARLLIDKGVNVFIDAATILKRKELDVEFWLIGDIDPGSSNSVSESQLEHLKKVGLVVVFGHRTDMSDLFARINILAYPSFYGEGLPKVLLEASASGRAIVTTDHPGCRDAINPGETGVLVPIKNSIALAEAIEELLLNPEKRHMLGKSGRLLAEREFSDKKIAKDHIKIFKSLIV